METTTHSDLSQCLWKLVPMVSTDVVAPCSQPSLWQTDSETKTLVL